jgi:hypothetical protein
MYQVKQIAALSVLSLFVYSTAAVAGWFFDDYKFTPPATAEGKACIEKCDEKQDSCSSQIKEKADKKFEDCENKNKQEYDSCLKYSSNRATCIPNEKVCIHDFVSTSSCEEKYRTCYQNCGGTVEILK